MTGGGSEDAAGGRGGDPPRGPRPGHDSDPLDATRSRRFVSTRVEVEGREETKIVELPDREPAPWDEDVELTVVGQRVPRMDALEKVTGRARYTADLQRPGMLHAAIVRAPIAHGEVLELDLEAALSIAGVRAAIVREDVEGIRTDAGQLFDRTIRYAGQPLAAVCAESEALAARAVAAVRLRVSPLPHLVTAAAALDDDAPVVRARGQHNRSRNSPRVHARGDVEAALRAADAVVSRTYRTPVALHTALEPHGAVAEWSGDLLTVWESTQGIFNTRSDVARTFRLPLNRVRVVKQYMGGGFGAKNGAHSSTYIAIALARRTGQPVRCVLDRVGEQLDAGNRPATEQRVTLAARHDGTLLAVVLDAVIPLGAGGWEGGPARIYQDLYACDNVRTTETFVYTHTSAMCSFRAPGHVEGAFGLECALDALARELGIDPLELRRRNYASLDQGRGRRYSDKRLDACYDAAAKQFGWASAPRAETPEPHSHNPRFRRGRGMASLTWGGGGGPPAYATVRMNPDGSVDVLTGSQDLGTGSRTIFAQIAAEVIGTRVEQVRCVLGDTERLPYTPNSWGSVTTASVGPAVRVGAEEVRDRVLEAASAMLEAEPHQLQARDGIVWVRGDDARRISFAEIGKRLGDVMIIGTGSRGPNPDDTTIAAFGAQFVEVEVDTWTGIVRVLRIVSAHDSGRIINPTLAESQLEGGILQGVGYALFEERVLDHRLGVPLNPTMHDYKIPTLADLPRMEIILVPGADVVANHTGAKGLAEPPIIPVAPAIANAVADAIGAEVHEIPLTPWRVLGALGSR